MKKNLLLSLGLLAVASGFSAKAEEVDTLKIYDGVVFYDGYRLTDNPDSLVNDGVKRHSCSLYSTKLSDEQLDAIGQKLDMLVTIEALCDNYDRIGNVNLAMVPKGETTYEPEQTDRIEIGRFITPFMNKNKKPTSVPYLYDITYLSSLLRDADFRTKYDFWLEFEVFGIPYAANQQVAGCEGRDDVFAGTLEFITDAPAQPTEGNILVPIVIKKPEYIGGNLNNYKEGATDEIGKTQKSYTFTVPEDVADSQLVLITSNHGANTGGEEYNRRWHFVYVDDELVLSYRPGRESCEPFRQYNTQANGIYGYFTMSDAKWQSFSNWCPGDVIDNRIINLGQYTAGEHKVTITVPDAQFVDKQGDIPVSLYFQGLKEGSIKVSEVESITLPETSVNIYLEGKQIYVKSEKKVVSVELYSVNGDLLQTQWNAKTPIDLSSYQPGIYVVCVETIDGVALAKKIIF